EVRRAVDGQAVTALDLLGEVRLVEPDQFHPAAAVLDGRLEQSHALDGRDARVRGDHVAAQQHGRIDVPAEVGDARGVTAVFVAVGEIPEQIIDGAQLVLFENLRPPRADAGEEADGGVGGDGHGDIVREDGGFYGRERRGMLNVKC